LVVAGAKTTDTQALSFQYQGSRPRRVYFEYDRQKTASIPKYLHTFYRSFAGPGLPDGKISYTKFQFLYKLEGLGVENVGTFYGYLVSICILWYLVIFFSVLICCTKKNLATLCCAKENQAMVYVCRGIAEWEFKTNLHRRQRNDDLKLLMSNSQTRDCTYIGLSMYFKTIRSS
jgi:hypothetical protein